MRPAVVPATTAAHRRRHDDAPDTAAPAVLLPPALLVPGAGPSAPAAADADGGHRGRQPADHRAGHGRGLRHAHLTEPQERTPSDGRFRAGPLRDEGRAHGDHALPNRQRR
ncbi:hypothetical protein GCM10010247_57380 [Streptomyces calvus]|uniref:Uncharacterized protein n=1 Tax=Streptomyces calvus TaxID=67282 RepID=A0A514JXK9_9ACTN|nr:hypothetical protein CD934_27860 [Streptomyces calvus]GGP76487.1 hypothetical protein GCM10010247_57380 [Streptomyces calvus]